jgi:hypothetical protein
MDLFVLGVNIGLQFSNKSFADVELIVQVCEGIFLVHEFDPPLSLRLSQLFLFVSDHIGQVSDLCLEAFDFSAVVFGDFLQLIKAIILVFHVLSDIVHFLIQMRHLAGQLINLPVFGQQLLVVQELLLLK